MRTFKKNSIPDLNYKKAIKKPIAIQCIQINEPFQVETLEGIMHGKKDDWLMIGIEGELYPCDATIFNKTYELIN